MSVCCYGVEFNFHIFCFYIFIIHFGLVAHFNIFQCLRSHTATCYECEMSNVVNVKIMILGPEYLGSLLRRKFYIHPLVHLVCVCVCVWVCVFVCMYVYMSVCMYVLFMYAYMYVYMYVFIMYVCMYVRIYVRMYVCMYVYMYVCMYILCMYA